jgi:AcrR family transcriptional regulator
LATKPGRGRKVTPRTRTSLSGERILAAAMRLALHSTEPLSLSRLGAALDADPTAVYRHFHSRDELLRAMADAVHEEVDAELQRIPADTPWRQALERQSWTIRRCFLRYPALAREYGHRVSGGLHEARGIRRFAEVLLREGASPEETVSITRAVAELVFGALSATAGIVILPEAVQREELARLLGAFRAVSPGWGTPLIGDQDLAGGQDMVADLDAQFAAALGLMLDGVASRLGRSPRPGGSPSAATSPRC